MTLQQIYEDGCKRLQVAGIAEAKLDAWYLLEHITGISRTQYFLHMDRDMDALQEQAYKEAIIARAKRIPLQHILGYQIFMGLKFFVNEYVLVPRQDTEVLVEEVLKDLEPGAKVLDMCTGSGCILISLLKFGTKVQGFGVDVSKEALDVANKNAVHNQVEAQFLHSDLFENVTGKYNVIVSNPPYIRTSVISQLEEEVKLHDPWIALDGKEDGLYFYRNIIQESPKFLISGGRLCFEIGHDQGDDVKRLMDNEGFEQVTVKKDLAGLDRVVCGVYNT